MKNINFIVKISLKHLILMMVKKTNYVLKEKEIDKKIRIEIDVNDLEQYIDQDF